MTFYRRNLPHYQPAGAEYFITFGLAGSLPKNAVKKLIQEQVMLRNQLSKGENNKQYLNRSLMNKKIFYKYEQLLHNAKSGPTWLSNPDVATIVKESLHHRDQNDYTLYAYCIMPNHVHMVFRHLSESIHQKENEYPITDILASLKKYTARLCNKVLNRTDNPFWHGESYDHVIRDSDELIRIVYYTLQNPVKAGLVADWKDWPGSFSNEEFKKLFR